MAPHSGDVFTVANARKAIAFLEAHNRPPVDGYYVVPIARSMLGKVIRACMEFNTRKAWAAREARVRGR